MEPSVPNALKNSDVFIASSSGERPYEEVYRKAEGRERASRSYVMRERKENAVVERTVRK